MSEDDLMSAATREPLRACCVKLAGRLWALLSGPAGPPEDPRALQVGLQPAQDSLQLCGAAYLLHSVYRSAGSPPPTPTHPPTHTHSHPPTHTHTHHACRAAGSGGGAAACRRH